MSDSFNDSSLFMDSYKEVGESNNENQFLDEDSKNNKNKDNYENVTLGDNKTSLSLHSDSEDFLYLYKIPKTKEIKISPSIKSKTNVEKNNIDKNSKKIKNKKKNKINKEIINVIFSSTKNVDEDKVIIVSDLERDFSNSEKDNTLEEKKLQNYGKNITQGRQNSLRNELEKKLRKLIMPNLQEKNKTVHLRNNKRKKIKEPRKAIDQSRLSIKLKSEKCPKNIEQPLTNVSHILNNLKINHTVGKKNTKKVIRITNMKSKNTVKKINVGDSSNTGSALFKKIGLDTSKYTKKKLNGFTSTNFNKNTKKEFKKKDFCCLHKQFKNLITQRNDLSIFPDSYNNNIDSTNTNKSCSCNKMRKEYSALNKKRKIIFKQVKKENSLSMIKNDKLTFFTNRFNKKNKILNNSFNIKKVKLRIKEKNDYAYKIPIKTNTSSNDYKLKKYSITIQSDGAGISKTNFYKNINKGKSLLLSKIYIKKDFLKKNLYIHKL